MKKNLASFVALVLCMTVGSAMGAVTIKKAEPVKTQQTSTSNATGSLVPSVLTLVSDVQALNAKKRDLDAECTPSSAEIEFVNNMMKEWAKTGSSTAEEAFRKLNRTRCDGGTGYESSVRYAAVTDMGTVCYDNFAESDKDMVWYHFPKASKAVYCPDGSPASTCGKNQKTVSNIYEVFDLIDFGVSDYNRQEATMAAKLLDRADRCSDVKISKKKKQMWGEFLTTAMGNVGQKTNTSAIMQTVGNITQNGASLNGGLSSLGSIASQFMDK